MFTFHFLMMKFTVIPKKAIWDLAIWQIGVLVNFIIQKLKSKHLVCLSFLWSNKIQTYGSNIMWQINLIKSFKTQKTLITYIYVQ